MAQLPELDAAGKEAWALLYLSQTQASFQRRAGILLYCGVKHTN
jgi:hypothetical protein